MIEFVVLEAGTELENQLIQLWQESFGDSTDYIQMFLRNRICGQKTAVCFAEGVAVSAAYLLPLRYNMADGSSMPCYYLYAAATLPGYRGKGCFGEILAFIREHILEPVILVPAGERLAAYYKKQGFSLWLSGKEAQYSKEQITSEDRELPVKRQEQIRETNASEYTAYRMQQLNMPGAMPWDKEMMAYICRENRFCGGKLFELCIENTRYMIMCRKEEEVLQVLEMLPVNVSQEQRKQAAYALLAQTDCVQARVCIQPTVMVNKSPEIFLENGYFNLTMG